MKLGTNHGIWAPSQEAESIKEVVFKTGLLLARYIENSVISGMVVIAVL